LVVANSDSSVATPANLAGDATVRGAVLGVSGSDVKCELSLPGGRFVNVVLQRDLFIPDKPVFGMSFDLEISVVNGINRPRITVRHETYARPGEDEFLQSLIDQI
jgi:hypothetical protein